MTEKEKIEFPLLHIIHNLEFELEMITRERDALRGKLDKIEDSLNKDIDT
jgi:hypothetical protein